MTKQKNTKVSLTEAIATGIILDLFLFIAIGIFIHPAFRTIRVIYTLMYLFAAHWMGNILVLIFRRIRQSRAGKDFIRFGLFGLILLAIGIYVLLRKVNGN